LSSSINLAGKYHRVPRTLRKQARCYTIGQASGTIVTNKLQGLMPYDYHDFTMLGVYLNWLRPWLFYKNKAAVYGFLRIVTYAKANPGQISVATAVWDSCGGLRPSLWRSTAA